MGDLKSGIRWSFIGTLVMGGLQFVSMTILARLLTPGDYGVYALCVAIIAISVAFIINVVERLLVVSDPLADERDESLTIAGLCLAASLIALGACFAINQFATGKIDLGILSVAAASTSIASVAVMPRVRLRRELRFGPLILAELSAMIVGQGMAAIGLAALGWGAYALALGACVQSATLALVLRWRMRGHPLAMPSWHHARQLILRSTALGGNAASEVANAQIAPLALGARLGPVALGLFNRSYSLVQMPIQLLVASMGRVMVSAIFSVSGERDKLRSTARGLVVVAAVVATPVAAGIAGASHNFVLFAFGPKWLAAAEIMPLLAIGAWALMMGSLFGIIAEAMRAFAAKTRVQLTSSLALALFLLIGAERGLVGAVAGIALAALVFLLLYARLASRLLDLPLADLLRWFIPGLVIALPCFGISLAIGYFWAGPPVAVFAAQVMACGLVDLAMLLGLYPALALKLAEAALPARLGMPPALLRYCQSARP